jgi:hypothetical protein
VLAEVCSECRVASPIKHGVDRRSISSDALLLLKVSFSFGGNQLLLMYVVAE